MEIAVVGYVSARSCQTRLLVAGLRRTALTVRRSLRTPMGRSLRAGSEGPLHEFFEG